MMRKFFLKLSIHTLVLIVLYLTIVFILSNIYLPKQPPVLHMILSNFRTPGGWGQTLKRFRDIKNYNDIDILFVGPSHAYRSFDPRIFKQYGFTSFNMGTTNQTPLNSYFLLKRYLNKLKPEILIVEVYVKSIASKDGLESFYDLALNLPLSRELAEMAFATRHPYAMNFLVSTCMGRITRPLGSFKQTSIPLEKYITGGYCETKMLIRENVYFGKPQLLEIADVQLNYLHKIIGLAQKNKIMPIFIMAPFPKEHLNTILNYDRITKQLKEFAEKHRIHYFDFNLLMTLDTVKDFKDEHHLNQEGVQKFNTKLIEVLKEKIGQQKTAHN